MRACSPTPPARTTRSTSAWCATTCAPRWRTREMLHEQSAAVAPQDLERIRAGLSALGEEHERGLWHVELADEDGQTALERRLTERIGAAGGRIHLGPLAQRSGAHRAAAVPARRDRCAGGWRGAVRSARSSAWAQRQGAIAAARLHPHAAGDAQLGGALGRRLRRRARRRCARDPERAAAHREESARLGRRLRHAGTAAGPVDDHARCWASACRRNRSPRCSSRAARPRRTCCSSWRC